MIFISYVKFENISNTSTNRYKILTFSWTGSLALLSKKRRALSCDFAINPQKMHVPVKAWQKLSPKHVEHLFNPALI
jgi:hypothetical protein